MHIAPLESHPLAHLAQGRFIIQRMPPIRFDPCAESLYGFYWEEGGARMLAWLPLPSPPLPSHIESRPADQTRLRSGEVGGWVSECLGELWPMAMRGGVAFVVLAAEEVVTD